MASTTSTLEPYQPTLPLTPRESDNGDLRHSPSMTGRKRNASEMEDESDTDSTSRIEEDFDETIEAQSIPPEFTVENNLVKKKRSKSRIPEDVYFGTDAPSLAPNLTMNYAIRPGEQYRKLHQYRNAKFREPTHALYSSGQVVYISQRMPVPPPPPAEATEDERLQYDKEHFWVGLIAEFRAGNTEQVYVRVFWFYWPEELPMGRKPYHGKNELVLSNHVDLVEAQTISSLVEISHWNENDDSNKKLLLERYWRQTYDMKKTGDNALSRLRRFCICGGYDDPNTEMYQCQKVGCGLWNHHACLIRALEETAWAKFKKGTLTHEREDGDEGKGLAQKVGETVSNLAHRAFGKDGGKSWSSSDNTVVRKGNKKRKGLPTGKHPWTGKLQGDIRKSKFYHALGTHDASVTQLVPTSSCEEAPLDFASKRWHMKLCCLKCGGPLDP
ncbi:uncharacterized protein PV06_00830 [Exophiala oligosperma]|uniref:BAH domain-containing protein n=1 Tax=Exophiala oligosperma TaxID=215243 RepID=A0A0D2EJY4_9EURO|nr:uncharacterized protein PV06_00830 [Exophiala oligosperma]KIW48219.1 hypothetical protein PV06_00830 [Exophiala oligosperma]